MNQLNILGAFKNDVNSEAGGLGDVLVEIICERTFDKGKVETF